MSYRPPRIIQVPHTLFTGSATTKTIDIATLLEDEYVVAMLGKVVANFTGGSVTAATLEIGVSGITDAFGLSTTLFTGAVPRAIYQVAAERGVALTTGRHASYGTPNGGPWALKATLTLVGGGMKNLTAGQVNLSILTGHTEA